MRFGSHKGHHGIGKTILLYISLGQQWRGVWNKALSDFWCNVKFSSSVTTEYKEIWKENLVIYQKSLKAFLQAPLQLNQAIKQQPINLWLRLWLEELTHWSIMLWTKNNKFGEMYYLHRSSSNIGAWNFLIILELFWYPNVAKKNMMMLFKGCKLFFFKLNCICCEVRVANEWYRNNRVIVNETKHQAIVLGKTGHSFLCH